MIRALSHHCAVAARLLPETDMSSGASSSVSVGNIAITAALLLVIAARAARTGYSPLVLVSERADAAFIATLGKWRAKLR